MLWEERSMKVIVGLGNPGGQYAETRHNVGFVLVDMIAEGLGIEFQAKFQGLIADSRSEGERIILLKPQTFMNLSGRSVSELISFYKVKPEDVIVIHDDMDLPLGKIRLRNKGSAGGHNGMRSIIADLGTEDFWRLKFGVGRPPAGWDPARYVLSAFTENEIQLLEESLERAEKAISLWITGDSVKAMNLYNRS